MHAFLNINDFKSTWRKYVSVQLYLFAVTMWREDTNILYSKISATTQHVLIAWYAKCSTRAVSVCSQHPWKAPYLPQKLHEMRDSTMCPVPINVVKMLIILAVRQQNSSQRCQYTILFIDNLSFAGIWE